MGEQHQYMNRNQLGWIKCDNERWRKVRYPLQSALPEETVQDVDDDYDRDNNNMSHSSETTTHLLG